MDYKLETMADVKAALQVRNLSYRAACVEVGRITGAMVSTSDHRSVNGDRLSNPMRGLWGLFLVLHDTIYTDGKEPVA